METNNAKQGNASPVVMARLSVFDRSLRPVVNPAAFLRECRRKLRGPYRIFRSADGLTVYRFSTAMDALTVAVSRNGAQIPAEIGSRF